MISKPQNTTVEAEKAMYIEIVEEYFSDVSDENSDGDKVFKLKKTLNFV